MKSKNFIQGDISHRSTTPPPPPPPKKKKLEKVYDKPRVFLDSFIGYRLVSVTKLIYDLIKKLCLRTFTNID